MIPLSSSHDNGGLAWLTPVYELFRSLFLIPMPIIHTSYFRCHSNFIETSIFFYVFKTFRSFASGLVTWLILHAKCTLDACYMLNMSYIHNMISLGWCLQTSQTVARALRLTNIMLDFNLVFQSRSYANWLALYQSLNENDMVHFYSSA